MIGNGIEFGIGLIIGLAVCVGLLLLGVFCVRGVVKTKEIVSRFSVRDLLWLSPILAVLVFLLYHATH